MKKMTGSSLSSMGALSGPALHFQIAFDEFNDVFLIPPIKSDTLSTCKPDCSGDLAFSKEMQQSLLSFPIQNTVGVSKSKFDL